MSDTNLTKKNRKEMIEFLEKIKNSNNDDETLRMVNKIENALTEKKFWLVFEEHREEVDDLLQANIPLLCEDATRRICKDENLPWNFIIEWDNLQALYLLLKTHRWRINVIYIDPPYNTWAHDWKYNNDYVDTNDGYRHSKWLSMMKVRLELAKQLLNPENSVLVCTIDEKEYLHLWCLLEELFPDAKIQMISSVVNSTSVARANEFNRNNEYIFFVMIGNYEIIPFDETIYSQNNNWDVRWRGFRRTNAGNTRDKTSTQFYPIYVEKNTGKIIKIWDSLKPEDNIQDVENIIWCETVFPIKDDWTEMMWWVTPMECKNRLSMWYVRAWRYTPNKPQKYIIEYLLSGTISDIENGKAKIIWYKPDGSADVINNEVAKALPKTQWNIKTHSAREYGTRILTDIFHDKRFPFPKSLYAVHDCLKYFIDNKRNAIVLDFFAGSGTTMHAVNLMNAEDWWNRRCIMVTNNEIWEVEEKRLKSLWYKKWDDEREKIGIAKFVTWPRTECSINWVDINWKPLEWNYLINDEYSNNIAMSDWFKTNVKYFKCDWTPRKPEDYYLSNILLLHIKEMIELENAVEIDGVKNVAILNKDDYKNFIENDETYKKIENIWVNQNIIFDNNELEKMKKKKFKYIPVEYFWQELKDVAE